MALDSTGKLCLWRLGDIRDGILGNIAHELRLAFQFPVLIQPAYLDERPSARPTWKGPSSTVFLEQVHRRHRAGTFVSLGITEANIVPDARHNFLFGYAYLGLPAAVISLNAMDAEYPPGKSIGGWPMRVKCAAAISWLVRLRLGGRGARPAGSGA
jgi:predicted Zn-dependent protease